MTQSKYLKYEMVFVSQLSFLLLSTHTVNTMMYLVKLCFFCLFPLRRYLDKDTWSLQASSRGLSPFAL